MNLQEKEKYELLLRLGLDTSSSLNYHENNYRLTIQYIR